MKQEQSSLEVGMNTFDEQSKNLEDYNDKTLTWTDFRSLSRMSIIVALADQKHKMFLWFHNWLIQKELNMKLKDWSSTELKRDFDKEFEKLKI